MRVLVDAIRNRLIKPCLAELEQANSDQAAANASAKDALDKVKGELDRLVNGTIMSRQSISQGADAVAYQVGIMLHEAAQHLTLHNVSVPNDGGGQAHAGSPDQSWETLPDTAQMVDREMSPLAIAIQRKERVVFWPKATAARWLIVVSSVLLAFQWLPLLLWWPIAIQSWRVITAAQARAEYDRLVKLSRPVTPALDRIRREADRQAELAIEALRAKLLPPAEQQFEAATQQLNARHGVALDRLRQEYGELARELQAGVKDLWDTCQFAALPWDSPGWESWSPDPSPEFAASIGTFTVNDPGELAAVLSEEDRRFALPALVPFGAGQCLLLGARGSAKSEASHALRSVALRVLATCPSGKARFTFVDPAGLGQNAAEFLALGDHSQALISGKAWVEPQHIEQQLVELTDHMETVIQKYLRNEFSSVREYNEAASEVAEPFRFLVVFDFPTNFTEASAKRLSSIVNNGPRCGVYTMIARDLDKALPYGYDMSDLESRASVIEWLANGDQATPVWRDPLLFSLGLQTDTFSDAGTTIKSVITVAGQTAVTSMKVEVPFEKLLVRSGFAGDGWWAQSTTNSLRAPLGPSGAQKLQYLTLGQGLAHHVLIVGRTGSGKTNLMHVIMTSLALAYPPTEMQLYLVDFKGGVGFKPYAQHKLPHAAVIAIESEREFGMSVLRGLDLELRRRSDVLRAVGVDNLADYRAKRPGESLPRILLVVDEYQEFFTQDDAIAQDAAIIFDRLVRQGRSFGLHIMLATQSLDGHARLMPSTLGQIAVRIALPCSGSDAQTIFAQDNTAARSLSRPGEAIYNAAAGHVEGNNPFQVALFGERDLEDYLGILGGLAVDRGIRSSPLVFEGNEPSNLADCSAMKDCLDRAGWAALGRPGVAWLGEPIDMGPTITASFGQQAGRHLLVVDRTEAEGVGLLQASWTGLLCSHRPTCARFLVLDLATADAPWAKQVETMQDLFNHEIKVIDRRKLPGQLDQLVKEINERLNATSSQFPPIYFLIQGLHRARELRQDDADGYSIDRTEGPSSSELFATLLKEGPEVGVHVLAWCDTLSNARRAIDRSLREFGMRVAGPMSADDSNSFLDVSDAARLVKPCRVVFYDEDQPGVTRTFRPFAVPRLDWLTNVSNAQRAWTDR